MFRERAPQPDPESNEPEEQSQSLGEDNLPPDDYRRAWRQLFPGAYNPEQNRQTAETYDKASEVYDQWLKQSGYKNLHAIKRIFKQEGVLLPALYRPERMPLKDSILDLGCGTGRLKAVLGPQFEYFGGEISHKMARKAKQNGYKDVFEHNTELITQGLPMDNLYDYVVASSSLQFIHPQHLPHVIRNMRRIASKGIIFTLDSIPPALRETMEKATGVKTYDHSSFDIEKALGDTKIRPLNDEAVRTHRVEVNLPIGWRSPKVSESGQLKPDGSKEPGMPVPVRVIGEFYHEEGDPFDLNRDVHPPA